MKIVAITSSATDAGKTYLSASIAEAASTRGLKALLLEFDLAVGDVVRVLGLSDMARRPHPTVTSWGEYENVWAEALRTKKGTQVLPRPENSTESLDVQNVKGLFNFLKESHFSLIVVDLGTDRRLPHWQATVDLADVVYLLSDCNKKSIERNMNFLQSYKIEPDKWVLAVNSREKNSQYSLGNTARILTRNNSFSAVIKLPHDAKVEKRSSKTMPAESKTATQVLLAGGLISKPIGQSYSPEKGKWKTLFDRFIPTRKDKKAGLPALQQQNKVVKLPVNSNDTSFSESNTAPVLELKGLAFAENTNPVLEKTAGVKCITLNGQSLEDGTVAVVTRNSAGLEQALNASVPVVVVIGNLDEKGKELHGKAKEAGIPEECLLFINEGKVIDGKGSEIASVTGRGIGIKAIVQSASRAIREELYPEPVWSGTDEVQRESAASISL